MKSSARVAPDDVGRRVSIEVAHSLQLIARRHHIRENRASLAGEPFHEPGSDLTRSRVVKHNVRLAILIEVIGDIVDHRARWIEKLARMRCERDRAVARVSDGSGEAEIKPGLVELGSNHEHAEEHLQVAARVAKAVVRRNVEPARATSNRVRGYEFRINERRILDGAIEQVSLLSADGHIGIKPPLLARRQIRHRQEARGNLILHALHLKERRCWLRRHIVGENGGDIEHIEQSVGRIVEGRIDLDDVIGVEVTLHDKACAAKAGEIGHGEWCGCPGEQCGGKSDRAIEHIGIPRAIRNQRAVSHSANHSHPLRATDCLRANSLHETCSSVYSTFAGKPDST